jgi:hypothetical protein
MRYEAKRSIADKELHLLLPEGMIAAIPHEILQLGPWRKLPSGEILRLKPKDRLAIARDGYALIRMSPSKFDRAYSQHQSSPISLAEWKKTRSSAK